MAITMENLPEEVILEILARLPVKSLLRFKSVSKSWLALISDPRFGKLHFQRSSPQTHRILFRIGSRIHSIDMNGSLQDDSATVKLDYPLLKPHVLFSIMGSFRGFLLLEPLWFEKVKVLFLWNPSTGVCKPIPPPLPSDVEVDTLYGFWYNESTDDYLLVLVSHNGLVLGFQVFSMRSNSWEKLALSYQIIRLRVWQKFGTIFNGAIHWLNCGRPGESKIIAFDITTKNLKEVPLPNDVTTSFNSNFGVLGGCLSVTESMNDKTRIWVMREYGVKSSWTKLISLYHYSRDHMQINPLCFTKDGQIVAEDSRLGLSKWSDKGQLLEHRQYPMGGFLAWAYGTAHAETLLSLP